MRYMTQDHIAKYPSLRDRSQEQVQEVLVVSSRLLGYINSNPLIDDGTLAGWMAAQGMDNDVAGRAMNYLRESGQLFGIEDSGLGAAPMSPPMSIDDFDLQDLRDAAAERDIEGRSKMNKGELWTALLDNGWTP